MKKWFKSVSTDIFKWITIIVFSYMLIQLINQYEQFSTWMEGILSSLAPFLLAFLFAYLLNPIMKQFEKRFKWSRGRSVLATYLLILIGVGIFVGVLGPIIYRNAMELIKQIPIYITKLTQFLNEWNAQSEEFGVGLDIFDSLYKQVLNLIPQAMELLNNSLSNLITFTMNIMTGTGNVILAFFISIYVLLTKESFCLMIKKVSTLCLGIPGTLFFERAIQLIHTNVGHYLVGKFSCSVIMAICCTIGILCSKGKYALLLGLIYGITNMIPLFGPIIGTTIIVMLHLFASPWQAGFLLIYLLAMQQIETLIIDPKLAGQKVGLTPFFTILGVILGGAIGGIVGMVLGVPILGVFKTLMVPWIEKQYEAKVSTFHCDETITES